MAVNLIGRLDRRVTQSEHHVLEAFVLSGIIRNAIEWRKVCGETSLGSPRPAQATYGRTSATSAAFLTIRRTDVLLARSDCQLGKTASVVFQANFVQTHDRLDVLARDTTGQIVVIKLKRDRAEDTTDLQAIKHASYCVTLTAEDIQRDYRQFWNTRREDDRSPEQVSEQFASFLGSRFLLRL